MMVYEITKEGSKSVVRIEGRFDYKVHAEFRSAIARLAEQGIEWEIDLVGTTYLDSSALGMLLMARDVLKTKTSSKIAAPQIALKVVEGSTTHKLLEIASFHRLFKIVTA